MIWLKTDGYAYKKTFKPQKPKIKCLAVPFGVSEFLGLLTHEFQGSSFIYSPQKNTKPNHLKKEEKEKEFTN